MDVHSNIANNGVGHCDNDADDYNDDETVLVTIEEVVVVVIE